LVNGLFQHDETTSKTQAGALATKKEACINPRKISLKSAKSAVKKIHQPKT